MMDNIQEYFSCLLKEPKLNKDTIQTYKQVFNQDGIKISP